MLSEREKTHGDFEDVSAVAGGLRGMLMDYENHKEYSRAKLSNGQKMALEMICLKIACIVCGDPNHADHWDDIAGYAMLGKGKEEGCTCPLLAPADAMIMCKKHAGDKIKQSVECSRCGVKIKDGEYGSISKRCWDCSWGIPKALSDKICTKVSGYCKCKGCEKTQAQESTSSKMEQMSEELCTCGLCKKPKGCYCSENPVVTPC